MLANIFFFYNITCGYINDITKLHLHPTEMNIDKRSSFIDHTASKPASPPAGQFEPAAVQMGFFPTLNRDILNTEPVSNK